MRVSMKDNKERQEATMYEVGDKQNVAIYEIDNKERQNVTMYEIGNKKYTVITKCIENAKNIDKLYDVICKYVIACAFRKECD